MKGSDKEWNGQLGPLTPSLSKMTCFDLKRIVKSRYLYISFYVHVSFVWLACQAHNIIFLSGGVRQRVEMAIGSYLHVGNCKSVDKQRMEYVHIVTHLLPGS